MHLVLRQMTFGLVKDRVHNYRFYLNHYFDVAYTYGDCAEYLRLRWIKQTSPGPDTGSFFFPRFVKQLKDTDVFAVSAGSQLWVVSWKTIGRGLEVGR
jgi:hypothetical protein